MKNLLTIFLFIILLTISCRVHKTGQIKSAYTFCVSADSVYANVDSLKYFLRNARGKLSVGYLIKGSSRLTIEYKNNRTRTIQILWGGQPTFHFIKGYGKNIWYTFSDTTINEQWHIYFKNIKNKCDKGD